jgi:hypothetical protein
LRVAGAGRRQLPGCCRHGRGGTNTDTDRNGVGGHGRLFLWRSLGREVRRRACAIPLSSPFGLFLVLGLVLPAVLNRRQVQAVRLIRIAFIFLPICPATSSSERLPSNFNFLAVLFGAIIAFGAARAPAVTRRCVEGLFALVAFSNSRQR